MRFWHIIVLLFAFSCDILFADNTVTPQLAMPTKQIEIEKNSTFGTLQQENAKVFGENLFGPQCKMPQVATFNPNYQIAIGDIINVQFWGAYEFNKQLTVDNQGNIFIPEVGPIHIAGVRNGDLNNVINEKLKTVFKKNVSSYANLITAQPVQVFVAGYVMNPGLYAGLSSDSLLYYLCQAGGINPREGSFRRIELVRDNKTLHSVDLYRFISNGDISHFQLHQSDTIVVKAIGDTVKVLGEVDRPYQYELNSKQVDLPSVLAFAGPKPNATFLRIQKNSTRTPDIKYIPLSQSKEQKISAGDTITLVSDQQTKEILITVEGAIHNPHQFVLPKGTTLNELIQRLSLTNEADLMNLQLFRPSIADLQKQAIEAGLETLERNLYTTTSSTLEGAAIRSKDAELLSKFVEHVRLVKPKGQVVVANPVTWPTFYLENNDTLHIPVKTTVVTVSGQVMTPISTPVVPGYSFKKYIAAAGGLAPSADTSHVLLLHANGEVEKVQLSALFQNASVRGGDQIIVPQRIDSQSLQVTSVLTKILYEVAIAAKVALTV